MIPVGNMAPGSSTFQPQAGAPGSFKLPNPGQPGTANKMYQTERLHPAAVASLLGPRANPLNTGMNAAGGRPTGAPAAGRGAVATPATATIGGAAK